MVWDNTKENELWGLYCNLPLKLCFPSLSSSYMSANKSTQGARLLLLIVVGTSVVKVGWGNTTEKSYTTIFPWNVASLPVFWLQVHRSTKNLRFLLLFIVDWSLLIGKACEAYDEGLTLSSTGDPLFSNRCKNPANMVITVKILLKSLVMLFQCRLEWIWKCGSGRLGWHQGEGIPFTIP